MKIKSLPKHKRPREKLMEKGVGAVSDAELVAIILRMGVKGKSAIELGKYIIKKFGIDGLLNVKLDDLLEIKGLGKAKAVQLVSAFELAKRAKDGVKDLPLNNPQRVVSLLQEYKNKRKEYFVALYLNARYLLLKKKVVSIGHLTATLVHPREVYKPAINLSAASIIVAHNHPSGDLSPSKDDISLTGKLMESGDLLDIELLDHLILGRNGWLSMKERGYF